MIKLTQEQELRKATFIARATRHFDTPEIRKEASEMWDKHNLPQRESWWKRLLKRCHL